MKDQRLFSIIEERVSAIVPRIRSLRREIHSDPEVGMETFGTAERIRSAFSGTQIECRTPLLGGDVIAELRGGSERRICLRADIDCNPIQEMTDLPHKSRNPGAMHACGHDGHTAMLIGAALVLESLREHLPVTVRFVFQPGEELLCGGKELVLAGACDDCDAAFALHGWPGIPVGAVASREGPIMAAGFQFEIRIAGLGCHGALPERGVNPIPVAAQVVSRLQELHRAQNADGEALVSTCTMNAGSFHNVIPDVAAVTGTSRFLSAERGRLIEESIRGIVEDTVSGTGCVGEVAFDSAYDLPVNNTQAGYQLLRQVADHLPDGNWITLDRASMAMEDFAFYLPGREGAMFFLGLGEESPPLHSARFDFNDDALAAGISMFCLIALSYR